MHDRSSLAEKVTRLGWLVGVVEPCRQGRFNWRQIESSLGFTLPEDYKILAEHFPRGDFQNSVRLVCPGDPAMPATEYLGHFAYVLDDMRGLRAGGHGTFPYPIFPEPGGVLPWGRGVDSGFFYWIMKGGDANEWSLAFSDERCETWQEMPGPIVDFLLGLVTGDERRSPSFEAFEEFGTVSPAMEEHPPQLWELMRAAGPIDEPAEEALREVCALFGLPPGLPTGAMDWWEVERRLGRALPADYKAFIDLYGPGTVGDLRIAAPGGEGPFDLFALLDRARIQVSQLPANPLLPVVHPATGGLLTWGETEGGRIYGWPTAGADPATWGTCHVEAPPHMDMYTSLHGVSFTAFLLAYATGDSPLLADGPRTGEGAFTPAG
ncbi:SMI1/KNR4 family protein [Streptomyces sp. NPDC051569]|uniref:SMI1/KNR4 family protein n=1 Tax=Streptomyces sp. NPDC051569 TaxID=3365661 RepID=UPI003796323B